MTPLPVPTKTQQYGRLWLLVAAACLAHLALGWLPGINLEWAFSDALLYFQHGDPRHIERYFAVQANTLGLSFSAYLLATLLPGLDAAYAPRLLSSLGILVLGAALIRIARLLDYNQRDALLVMLALINPMVWVYSGRGTADFLPAALALYSVSLFWDKTVRLPGLAIAIVAFSTAIVIKYHAALLLPLLWLEALGRANADYKSTLWRLSAVSALVLSGPLLYVLLVRQTLGFWFIPPAFQHSFPISFSSFATNCVSYLGYLSLLLLPLSMVPLLRRLSSRRSLVLLALAFSALFALGYVAIEPDGEMNFGPLDRYLNSQVASGILCASAGLLVFVLQDCFAAAKSPETRRLLICLLLGIALFIAVLSFTRPAQRYLLFALPLAYYFVATPGANRKMVVGAAIALMMSVNLYVGISQYATGTASRALVQQLVARGLLERTNPGDLLWHAGNAFPLGADFKDATYTIVNGHHPEQMLFAESAPLPFIRRAYSVIPIPH
jgi:hypothetical protein